jgi:hypothetical protein
MTWAVPVLATLAAAFPEPNALPERAGLPDPLVMLDGTRVATPADWHAKRKPELRALFQHYMYGRMPAAPARVTGKVVHEDARAFGGTATLREIALTVLPEPAPPVYLLLVTPNAGGPSPVFVGLNFSGNHTLVPDPGVRIPTAWLYDKYPGVVKNRATEAGRGKLPDVWNIEKVVARGYSVATIYNGDIDPDRKEERGGLRPFLPQDTATIAAWAWGVSRAIDYLVTDKAIDPKRVIAVGHSRLGKTALVAAAFDERIALAIPSQAGCGGTAPSRGTVGESVTRINTAFPHWFCGSFKQFNDRTQKLPFDQNCLAALVAPRPLLFSNAVEDTWANPGGQFEVLKAAEPAYKLLGAGGCDASEPPPPGKLVDSTLGYFIRPGKHSMTPEDWTAWLAFADKHLGKPAGK